MELNKIKNMNNDNLEKDVKIHFSPDVPDELKNIFTNVIKQAIDAEENDAACDDTCACDEDDACSCNDDASVIVDEPIQNATKLIAAGATPAEAAEFTGVPIEFLAALGNNVGGRDWVVPVEYTVNGYVLVRAVSALDAVGIANGSIDDMPLCEATSYVEDSYEVTDDPDLVELLTKLWDDKRLVGEVTPSSVTSPLVHYNEDDE